MPIPCPKGVIDLATKKRKAGKYEASPVKTHYRAAKKPKKSGRKVFSAILIILVVICFLGVGAFGAYLYFFSNVTPGLIMDNISILGISLGGMSEEDAVIHLQNTFNNEYCANRMVVSMYGQKIEIPAKKVGLHLDAASVVEAAYGLGRTGTQANRKLQQMQAMTSGIQMEPEQYLTMDTDALHQELSILFDLFPTEPVDSSWELSGERPDLSSESQPETEQKLIVKIGTPGYAIDMEALVEKITEAYLKCDFTVSYSCDILQPQPVDLEQVFSDVCLEPVEAEINKETFEVSAHSHGYTFDLQAAQAMQQQAQQGSSVEVPFSTIAPTNTKQALESLLFRDVLGTYTAYSVSDPENRDVNLKLSCQAINGIVLMPGEIFSYNPALGERTPQAGWKEADGYDGSATIKTYGGGICQASSCLYLSALLADLEIVERVNHGFISAYMPYGMDATVSWGGPEFRFKNSTEYPLRIEAWASGGAVSVRLVGTDTKDYYVKMTYDILETEPYETVEKEFEADNEDGYIDGQTVITGYTGYKIRTYRCKYSKETNELISREVEATSVYSRRDEVICKIKVDPSQPTEPTEAPTEETPPEEPTNPGISGPVTEDG